MSRTLIQQLNQLWQSRGPRVLKIPSEFPFPENVLEWSLARCQEDPSLVGTIMRNQLEGVDEKDEGMMYAARGKAPLEVRQKLVEAVRDGHSVQLQVNSILSKHPPFQKFVDDRFIPELKKHYPFGCTVGNALFVTGGGHTYNAHNDPGDNFLFQLHGRKIVRVWGPSSEFQNDIFFDYDFRGRPEMFSGPVEEVELNAGEVLYFHDGMMHEVRVPEDQQTVSLAIRADAHYSVLTLVREVSSMVGDPNAYGLISEANYWDKFRAKVFNPNLFADSLKSEDGKNHMPASLKQELMKVVVPASYLGANDFDCHMDAWWQDLCSRRNHCPTGCFPVPPPDRVAQLKAWEDERLRKKTTS